MTEETIAAGFETALVVQVLDGDTIEVLVEGVAQRLRYIGIDSPEDGQPYSVEAEALNRALVEGKQVILEKDVSETDRFERLLRYVFLLDGTFVNAELVRLGMAHAAAYEPDTSYQGYFEEMQALAQEQGLGIWGQPEPTATNPVVGEGLIIDPACSQFNAPGNDNDNKNEEYVCVVNLGAEGIDISGWVLHDAYGWKYTFPIFVLRAGTGVLVRTGCGEDTESDLHWCREETAVWNNDGDCANLLDAAGELVYQYCY
jgi:endonuclease YncB( thermonuclease family)